MAYAKTKEERMQWVVKNRPYAVRWSQEFDAMNPYKIVKLKGVTETGAFDYDFTGNGYNRKSVAEYKAETLNKQLKVAPLSSR